MEGEGDCTTDSRRESIHSCAKAGQGNIEEGLSQEQIQQLTGLLDGIVSSLKSLVFEQPAAKECLLQQVEEERKRIQSSHRKVDAVTNYMRAYGDCTTEMTGHNEKLRTGIYSRIYGLQGIVAEIQKKNLLERRLDELQRQSKARGIDVSPGATSEYKKPQEETTPHTKCDPKTVREYFDYFKEEFLQVVAAKYIASKLTNKNVLPKSKETAIEKLDDEEEFKANSILFWHLQKHADYGMAEVLCCVMMEEPAYPRMNKLGRKMLDYLKAYPGMT